MAAGHERPDPHHPKRRGPASDKGTEEPPNMFGGRLPPEPAMGPNSGSIIGRRDNSLGREITASLSHSYYGDTFYTSDVNIPAGCTEIKAIEALNSLAKERLGRALIDYTDLRKLQYCEMHKGPENSERRLSVILLVDGTKSLGHTRSVDRLAAQQMAPVNPLHLAIVLLAETINDDGRCFVKNFTIQTSNKMISLRFDSAAGKLRVLEGAQRPAEETMMGGTPSSATVRGPTLLQRIFGPRR